MSIFRFLIRIIFFLENAEEIILTPLTTKISNEDYKMIIDNHKHLKGIFGNLDNVWWPPDELTESENLKMLTWHEHQFLLKESFAYAIFKNNEYIGCFYIFGSEEVGSIIDSPSSTSAYVFMFTTKENYENGTDAQIFQELKIWMLKCWEFPKIEYPGREIPITKLCNKTAAWILVK